MTPIAPVQQPPIEDLRNVLQMLTNCMDSGDPAYWGDLNAMRKRIQGAIEGLSEPNEAAIQMAQKVTRFANGDSYLSPRDARDVAAAILSAQLRGTL